MIVELDDAKVFKHFGRSPERGKLMKQFATSTVNAGMKVKNLIIFANHKVVGKRYVDSALPDEKNPHTRKNKKGEIVETWVHPNASMGMTGEDKVSHQWVPNPVQVWPVLALRRLRPGHYEVQVRPEFLEQSVKWLTRACGKSVVPQGKRGKRPLW